MRKALFVTLEFLSYDLLVDTGLLALLLMTSLSVREVWGSIPGLIKSDQAPSPLRPCFGAVLPRRQVAEMDLVARFSLRRNTASMVTI